MIGERLRRSDIETNPGIFEMNHQIKLLLLVFPFVFSPGCGRSDSANSLQDASSSEVQEYLDMVKAQDAKIAGETALGREE